MLRSRDCHRHHAACGVVIQGEMNIIVWSIGGQLASRQVMQSIKDAALVAADTHLASERNRAHVSCVYFGRRTN